MKNLTTIILFLFAVISYGQYEDTTSYYEFNRGIKADVGNFGSIEVEGDIDLSNGSTDIKDLSISGVTFFSITYDTTSKSTSTDTLLQFSLETNIHYSLLDTTTLLDYDSLEAKTGTYIFIIVQDTTGSRSVTFNSNRWQTAGGSTPTITTTASAKTMITAFYDPKSYRMIIVSTDNISDL